jgi:hypothetical protein
MKTNKNPNIPRKIYNNKYSRLFTSLLNVVVVEIDSGFIFLFSKVFELIVGSEIIFVKIVEVSVVFFVFSKIVEVIVGSDFLVVVE